MRKALTIAKPAHFLLTGVILILSALVFYQYRVISTLERKQEYIIGPHQQYVERAKAEWARHTTEDVNRVMIQRHPAIVEFENELCVKLELDRGSLGGVPVYCFDKDSGAITRRHENVE